MSKPRRPTAGTFARLAVASAVACAVVPEAVDRLQPMLAGDGASRVPEGGGAPGTRVMGSLQTAGDTMPFDRLRFADRAPYAQPDADGGATDAGAANAGLPNDGVAAVAAEPEPRAAETLTAAIPEQAAEPPEARQGFAPHADPEATAPGLGIEPVAAAIGTPAAAAAPQPAADQAGPVTAPSTAPVKVPAPVMAREPRDPASRSMRGGPTAVRREAQREVSRAPAPTRATSAGGERIRRRPVVAAEAADGAGKWTGGNPLNWPE